MKKARKILAGVMITILATMIIPIKTQAAETTSLEVVQTGEDKYIIYIQDLQKKEFNYAISEKQTVQENDLKYFKSTQDDDENQVAVVEKNVYDFAKSQKAYLWIKQGDKQIASAQEIDFSKAFTKSKIEEVENTSKRINTEIVSDLSEKEKTDENGVKITTTVGGIKIKDTENAKYFYQLMTATDEYGTLMETAEKLKDEYNKADMYTTIKMAKDFYEKYSALVTKANWNEVQNMEIRQPQDATEGSKYVVFIKKVEGNKETYDVKFLTSQKEQNPAYARGKKLIQEIIKLPFTGDNLSFYRLSVGVLTTVALFLFAIIRYRNKHKKNLANAKI